MQLVKQDCKDTNWLDKDLKSSYCLETYEKSEFTLWKTTNAANACKQVFKDLEKSCEISKKLEKESIAASLEYGEEAKEVTCQACGYALQELFSRYDHFVEKVIENSYDRLNSVISDSIEAAETQFEQDFGEEGA